MFDTNGKKVGEKIGSKLLSRLFAGLVRWFPKPHKTLLKRLDSAQDSFHAPMVVGIEFYLADIVDDSCVHESHVVADCRVVSSSLL